MAAAGADQGGAVPMMSDTFVAQSSRKIRPIPPPLDLSHHRSLLDEASNSEDQLRDFAVFSASPRSPYNTNQKHLPFRKRAFSWTNYHDEGSCHSLSPSSASATLQRSTYSALVPSSPHVTSRVPVFAKKECLGDQPSPEVFVEYLIPKMEIKEEEEEANGALAASAQSPAFPTPVTPSPRSPAAFPPASRFFPQHFQAKTSCANYPPWSASSLLLSPAHSLHSSSQEELTQCRQYKSQEAEMEASIKEDDFFQPDAGQGAQVGPAAQAGQVEPGTSDLCERLQRFDFVIPSPKSKEKRCCLSVSEEPTTAGPGLAPPTAKRPMNGFMLFAQKYRLQLIQQYPGRDNRAISVMLGDAWKRLNPTEKEVYTAEAHLRAEEYRRLYPDCWKRKRSKSTS